MGSAADFHDAARMIFSREFWRMGVLWTISLLYSYLLLFLEDTLVLLRLRRARAYRHAASGAPSMGSGRLPICVVTGATSGLGAAAAAELAKKGYYVVLVGRSLEQLSKTMQSIKQQTNSAHLKAFQADLSTISSIVDLKNSVQDWISASNLHYSIQLLVNNAGILACSPRVTADGYDQMMETNYVSAFALTNLLLPLLKNSPMPSRIVNVTSFTHRCVSGLPFSFEQGVKYLPELRNYPFAHTYERSKFYLLLLTYELHRKLYLMTPSGKISVMAADPGAVETNIMRELPRYISWTALSVLKIAWLLQAPEKGIASIMDAALSPEEASGMYFFSGNGRTIGSSSLSYNVKLAQALWNVSERLLREAIVAVEMPN